MAYHCEQINYSPPHGQQSQRATLVEPFVTDQRDLVCTREKMHFGSQNPDLPMALRKYEGKERGVRAVPKFILSNWKDKATHRNVQETAERGFQEQGFGFPYA